MVEEVVPSLSETMIVNMPLSLGVAVSPSWTTIVNVELYVGRTFDTVGGRRYRPSGRWWGNHRINFNIIGFYRRAIVVDC